jgi:hypothetical protein
MFSSLFEDLAAHLKMIPLHTCVSWHTSWETLPWCILNWDPNLETEPGPKLQRFKKLTFIKVKNLPIFSLKTKTLFSWPVFTIITASFDFQILIAIVLFQY